MRTNWMVAVIVAATATLSAQNPPTLTGAWQMGLQGDHVIPTALVLNQDGKAVSGTLALPTHRVGERIEVTIEGEFVERALIMTGTVDLAGESMKLALDGTLNDDGTLEGTLKLGPRTLPWTAERLRGPKGPAD
jgi:hypothetical protein